MSIRYPRTWALLCMWAMDPELLLRRFKGERIAREEYDASNPDEISRKWDQWNACIGQTVRGLES